MVVSAPVCLFVHAVLALVMVVAVDRRGTETECWSLTRGNMRT